MADPTLQRAHARRAALAYLYEREGLALTLDAIVGGISATGEPVTGPAVAAALAFLISDGLVSAVPQRLSGTDRYQITADGARAHERG